MCCVVLLWDALWHLCISCTPSLLFRFVRRQQVADGRSCEFDGEAVSLRCVFINSVRPGIRMPPLLAVSLWPLNKAAALLSSLLSGLRKEPSVSLPALFPTNLLFAFAVILSSMCQQCLSLRNWLSQANLCPGGVQLSSSFKASRHHPPHVRPSWQCL